MSKISERSESLWPSIAFWLSAVAAAALVGAVLLAPKLEVGEGLAARARTLTIECQALDQRSEHLGQLLESLKHDPNLIGELARSEFDLAMAGEERIAVSPEARRATGVPTEAALPDRDRPAVEPWWRPIQVLFARDAMVRQVSLAAAAVLLVSGFTFFQCPREGSAADEDDESAEIEDEDRRPLDEIDRFVRGYRKRAG